MRGWRIGRIGGIAIEVNPSWLLILALVVDYYAKHVFVGFGRDGNPWLPWIAALATAILFFASVLLHELSHSFVAKRMGIGVSRITLFVFGGVAQIEDEPKKATDELLISLAGPAMSMVLALAFAAAWQATARFTTGGLIPSCLEHVARVNFLLAVFNMVPGFPLDGGRVLRSLLWHFWGDILPATRVASILGQIVGYGIVALGIGVVMVDWVVAVFYIGMGLLLATVARSTYSRERMRRVLERTRLRDLAAPPELAFQVGTPLSVAVPYYLNRQPNGWVPILHAAQPVGVLSYMRMTQVAQSAWPGVRVEHVMDPLIEEMVIRHSEPASEALRRISEAGRPDLIVVDDWGNLTGIVTEASLQAALASGVPH